MCGKNSAGKMKLTSALSTLNRTLTTLSVSSAQVTSRRGQPSSIWDSLSPRDLIRTESLTIHFSLKSSYYFLPPDTWYAKRKIFRVFQSINFLIMGIIMETISSRLHSLQYCALVVITFLTCYISLKLFM